MPQVAHKLMLYVYLLCESTKLLLLLLLLYIYIYIEVIQSALMCYIPKFLRKKYIPLPNLNSDDVITSRGNKKFHLHLFVKGGLSHTLFVLYFVY
jgi:hypothetical protein